MRPSSAVAALLICLLALAAIVIGQIFAPPLMSTDADWTLAAFKRDHPRPHLIQQSHDDAALVLGISAERALLWLLVAELSARSDDPRPALFHSHL